MPLALDPNQTIKLVLESDKLNPNPPTFEYKALTGRQWLALAKMADSISGGDLDDVFEKTYSAASTNLVGWTNMGMEFDASKLMDIINPMEAHELIQKLLSGNRASQEDKKKSD